MWVPGPLGEVRTWWDELRRLEQYGILGLYGDILGLPLDYIGVTLG